MPQETIERNSNGVVLTVRYLPNIRFAGLTCFSMAFVYGTAFAIGDSGGCQRDKSPFINAISTGTTVDIDAAVETHLSPIREQRGPVRKITHFLLPSLEKSWRMTVLHELVNEGPCNGNVKPLDYAVHWGNIGATKWLLDHGANANAWNYAFQREGRPNSNLYTRASNYGPIIFKGNYYDAEVRRRRLETFQLTIDAGGDVRFNGDASIRYSNDIELIKLFKNAGAVLAPGHMEERVNAAIECPRPATTDACLNAIEVLAFYIEQGTPISGAVRTILQKPVCGRASYQQLRERYDANCAEVRRLLAVN